MTLDLSVPVEAWRPNTAMDDPLNHLTVEVTIAGTPMFLEAWEVRLYGDIQIAVYPGFRDVLDALPGDGPFTTTTINGREYVLVATPHNA